MYAINCLFAANPFYDSYYHSDLLGKMIFLSIIFTSIIGWVILILKFWVTRVCSKNSKNFYNYFLQNRNHPLNLDWKQSKDNPFFEIYKVLKQKTVDLLNKNRRFGGEGQQATFLSSTDIEYIESHLLSTVAGQVKNLEANLFILATIVGLAPLLGLLGTVWGILITFSDLQTNPLGGSNQMMLHGLSLALTTTVLGLVAAIPALIAHNWLKNGIRGFETEMEGFSTEALAAVELQYRKVNFS
jgi:biopolymer transport protein TolQ